MDHSQHPFDTNLAATILDAAEQIVEQIRCRTGCEPGTELRLPLIVGGSDLRVLVAAGPSIGALNAIEAAKVKAGMSSMATQDERAHLVHAAALLLHRYSLLVKNMLESGALHPDYAGQAKQEQQMAADIAQKLSAFCDP